MAEEDVSPVVLEPTERGAPGMAFLSEQAVEWFVGPNSRGDPRTRDWPLMDWRVSMAIGCAYTFGIPLGVWLMSSRQPFKMTKIAALHNAFLFSLSLYMTIETLRQAYFNFGWGRRFQLWCNPVEPLPHFTPSGYGMARILWIHYVSKAFEFMDTIIMVLRKKSNQISFLHMYHHATTFFPIWWEVLFFGPGGEAYFTCAMNSFVHVIMYGYYFSTTFGVRLPAIKPFITCMQMSQFLALGSQGIYHFATDCYRPRLTSVFLIVHCAILFTLFANFAMKAYLPSKRKAKAV